MITRVAVFGAGGMLGRAVVEELRLRGLFVLAFDHGACDTADANDVDAAFDQGVRFEAAINCAGVRPGPPGSILPTAMVRANAVGPWVLSAFAFIANLEHLVQVSTDCVFSGDLSGNTGRRYWVDDPAAPRDLYGRSKLAGELVGVPNATTVRTSFIGPNHGMLGFILDAERQGERFVNGWRRAYWTGSTVWAVARGLCDVVLRPPTGGIEHLATGEKVTKYEVLATVRRLLGLQVQVIPVDMPRIDRALQPTILLPPLEHELRELVERCRPAASVAGDDERKGTDA